MADSKTPHSDQLRAMREQKFKGVPSPRAPRPKAAPTKPLKKDKAKT